MSQLELVLSRLELWFLRRILRKIVTQGYYHSERIKDMYREIRVACEREFYEDNAATISSNLEEWFQATQVWPSSQQKNAPTKKQLQLLKNNQCPYCEASDSMQEGPSGGMCTNYRCSVCLKKINMCAFGQGAPIIEMLNQT